LVRRLLKIHALRAQHSNASSAMEMSDNVVEAHVWIATETACDRLKLPLVYPVTAIACAAVAERLLQAGRPLGAVSPVDLFESGQRAVYAAQLQLIK
jgi:hypothetical protein